MLVVVLQLCAPQNGSMSAVGVDQERPFLEDAGTADSRSMVSGGKSGRHSAKGKRVGGGSAKGRGGKSKGKGKGKSGGKSGGGGGKAGKKTSASQSRSKMAGLTFPVGRIHHRMKDGLLRKQRCGASAAIYCASLLEYMTAELLELAGMACKEMKCKRITPRHLLLAIRGDDELDQLVKATISGGGVVPHLHQALQKKSKHKKKQAA